MSETTLFWTVLVSVWIPVGVIAVAGVAVKVARWVWWKRHMDAEFELWQAERDSRFNGEEMFR